MKYQHERIYQCYALIYNKTFQILTVEKTEIGLSLVIVLCIIHELKNNLL